MREVRVRAKDDPFVVVLRWNGDELDPTTENSPPGDQLWQETNMKVALERTIDLSGKLSFGEWKEKLLSIPDSFLVIARRLKKLTIGVEESSTHSMELEYMRSERGRPNHKEGLNVIEIEKTNLDDPGISKMTKFYIHRHKLSQLPNDTRRMDLGKDSLHDQNVVLAFPTDGADAPTLITRAAYANFPCFQMSSLTKESASQTSSESEETSYIVSWRNTPLKASGLKVSNDLEITKINSLLYYLTFFSRPSPIGAVLPSLALIFEQFLVQSDFICKKNNPIVDHLSTRNQAVLAGVAVAFQEAVQHMCNHPTLQFGWVQYIPEKDLTDPFWESLREKLIQNLQRTTQFRSQFDNVLKTPSKLRLVTATVCDQDGYPLLEDLREKPLYLSTRYKANPGLLQDLGITPLKLLRFAERLEADLSTPNSRWKENAIAEDASSTDSPAKRTDWYLRVCAILLQCHKDAPVSWEKIRTLELIPLRTGKYVSAAWVTERANRKLVMPDTDGTPIPKSLNSNTMHQAAVSSPTHRELYQALGVQERTPSIVVNMISKKLKQGENNGKASQEDLENSVAHLRYLYTHASRKRLELISPFPFIDSNMTFVSTEEHLYYPDEADYGPIDMLESNETSSQEFQAHFLNPEYIDLVCDKSSNDTDHYISMLKDVFGIKLVPQLLDTRNSGISDELRYIERHRADRLVGLLWKHWATYRTQILKIRKALRKVLVPLENGLQKDLSSTILPLPSLKELTDKFELENVPYIQPPDGVAHDDLDDLVFLGELGVIVGPSLDFHLVLLEQAAAHYCHRDCPGDVQDHIFELYGRIAKLASDENVTTKIR